MKLLIALTLTVLVTAGVAACGDDDGTTSPTPTDVIGETPTPDTSFKALSRAALRPYLEDVGLDGKPGELTDPAECADLPDKDVDGAYCIVEPSIYTPALALILVASVDDRENEGWQVRVVLGGDAWQVTEAMKLGDE